MPWAYRTLVFAFPFAVSAALARTPVQLEQFEYQGGRAVPRQQAVLHGDAPVRNIPDSFKCAPGYPYGLA